jgi:hypothetical protein
MSNYEKKEAQMLAAEEWLEANDWDFALVCVLARCSTIDGARSAIESARKQGAEFKRADMLVGDIEADDITAEELQSVSQEIRQEMVRELTEWGW